MTNTMTSHVDPDRPNRDHILHPDVPSSPQLSTSEGSFISAASEHLPIPIPRPIESLPSQSNTAFLSRSASPPRHDASPSDRHDDRYVPNHNDDDNNDNDENTFTHKYRDSIRNYTSAPTSSRLLTASRNTTTPAPAHTLPQQPDASTHDTRLPIPRRPRPPASRSSHGIETRSGPPPALITQRTAPIDQSWRGAAPHPSSSTGTQRPPTYSNTFDMADSTAPDVSPHRSHTIHGRPMGYTSWRRGSELGLDPTVRATDTGNDTLQSCQDDSASKKDEDLFLNLARAESVMDGDVDAMSRAARRRSRLGLGMSRTTAPSASGRPTSSSGRFFGPAESSTSGHSPLSPQQASHDGQGVVATLASLRDEASRDRPYASSAHPLDHTHRSRYSGMPNSKLSFSGLQQVDSGSPGLFNRRRSINAGFQSRFDSPSTLGGAASGRQEESSPRHNNVDGTESTISTTAPSTVWDELDDLKSRIRKIELTGGVPSTSNAAMSNGYGDRPVTANTTVTNTSSSPKQAHQPNASPRASTHTEQSSIEVQPLLQSALSRAKATGRSSLYTSLEATITDALKLAAMTNSKQNSNNSGSLSSAAYERQLRRKTDGLCRSLTELCIAVAEEDVQQNDRTVKTRLNTSEVKNQLLQNVSDSRFGRAVSEDPDLRASSRVMSRLEARRTSLGGASSLGMSSPKDSPRLEAPTPTQDHPQMTSKLERPVSMIRRRDDSLYNNSDSGSMSYRPLSRAATDAGSHRHVPQLSGTREYKSTHPLPQLPTRSPSVQTSSTSQRRSYFNSSTTTSSPIQPGARRYLDRSTPPITTETSSGRLAEARQRRMASLSQSNVPSPRTSMLPNRLQEVE